MMKKQIVLQVNEGLDPALAGRRPSVDQAGRTQVNITTQVNASQIRREQINGRDSWIVPSYTLPAGVIMNGGLYTAAEIDAHYQELEGTVAPLGHPVVDGKFVSAFSPEGLAGFYVGATNRNAKKAGNRIYVEKVIDVETASKHEGGQRLLERLEALEKGEDVPPIHTSVAAFLEQLEPNEEQSAQGAQWVAKIHAMDHDAILLDEVGAATPEQGVGMMVNADQAQPLAANTGALVGESYRQREERLSQAARKRWATGADEYVWVADFTDSQAVIVRNGGVSEVYGYEDKGGAITFADTGTAVVRQESWVTAVANSLKRFFTQQARPAQPPEGNMPITAEERADLIKGTSEAVAANMAEPLKNLTDAVTALQANQTALAEQLTANARAEEAEKRKAVAAVHGDVVANALSGEPLDAMFKSLGTAATIGANAANQPQDEGAPDPAAYFGGAK
ncbi:hypothetical protein [uncultured Castellaniella sp.]|uniref:hypothetical protein n=1 Tax=uncultured Castellaniella sp. TaxID=647907 RepID=UPI002630E27F|nr:hypothetical protein [uncultured Castellaniella sp.]